MNSQKSNLQLLFDPEKIKSLSGPFIFFGKIKKDNTIQIRYLPFSEKNIMLFCRDHKLLDKDWIFKCLTADMIKTEKDWHRLNHRKLNLKTGVRAYVQKHLAAYYYDHLLFAAKILKNNPSFYHRYKISENRFRNSICSLDYSDRITLSFEAEKVGNRIRLKTYYSLKGKLFPEDEVQRFGPLIRHENTYYFLTKNDWILFEQLEKEETFSYSDFNTKTLKMLSNYPVDMSSAYTEEIIEIAPEKLIHISELGGEMLLFLPRWSYDGHVVDDKKDVLSIYDNDRKTTYIRDKKAEQETLDFLEQAHPKFKDKKQFYLKFKEASKNNWFFHFYHNQLKDNFTITGMDMLGYFRYSESKIETEFKIVKTMDNLISARFITHFGKEKIETATLRKALTEGNDFVLLKDQSLGVLTEEWKENYKSILQNSRIEGDEISFAKWILLIPQKKEIAKQANRVLPADWMEKWKQWNQSSEILYSQPKQIQAQLRPYQQKGYEWFNLMSEIGAGTLLADDMGLGKTLQAITALQYWLGNKPESKFLIVCPASLIYNWKKEFEKFAPDIPTEIYHGSNRNIEQFLIDEKNVLITSYALVRNDQEIFSSIVWDAAVLDESHQIKNTQAQKTQAVMELNAQRRILLNGTPIMNSVEDLFSQFHFLLPQLFPSLGKFRKQFVNPIKKGGKEAALEELRILTQPFLLRRTKELAAPDLPAKTETTLWCEMKTDQREAYDLLKSQIRKNILVQIADTGLQKSKLGVLQGINKLRQMCSSPHIVQGDFNTAEVSSVKVQNLIEILTTDLADEKVLVFSQFLGTMELLKEEFEKNGILYLSFSGKTPVEKRIELVNEFQTKGSKIQVFLLSLMAGNSGINLTNANYVFLLEPWWNKAVQQQAIDRVHRIGQTQNVFAYNMICKDSIEEKIKFIQDQKHSLSEEIITDDEGFLKNLSKEDIEFLFD